MTSQQFIFSNERKYILARHLSFWISFSVVCFITGSYPYKPRDLLSSGFYIVSLEWVICFIPISIIFTYLFLHFVLPAFITKRNFRKILLPILAGILFNILIACLLNRTLLSSNGGGNKQEDSDNLQLTYFHSIVFTILLASVVTAVLVIKGWYKQTTENTNLYKQKIHNERNILKSKVYPTFLFNSLNTLYKQIDLSCDNAARLLLNLSDILSYILYDSGNELVLLNKELTNIRNYVEIVKEERGNIIVLNEDIPDQLLNKFIPPLLMFSILESVLSETNYDETEKIAVSITEKNMNVEFTIIYDFNKSGIIYQDPGNIMKAIETRLQAFTKVTKELNVTRNEDRFKFSTKIELTDFFNF